MRSAAPSPRSGWNALRVIKTGSLSVHFRPQRTRAPERDRGRGPGGERTDQAGPLPVFEYLVRTGGEPRMEVVGLLVDDPQHAARDSHGGRRRARPRLAGGLVYDRRHG